MKISGTTTLTLVPEPEATVNLVVNPQTVLCKRGEITYLKVYVDLYQGTELIPYGKPDRGNMQCGVLTATGKDLTDTIKWNFGVDDDDRFYYTIRCDGSAEEDIEVPFTVTFNGKTYPSRFAVRTIGSGRGAVLRGPQLWNDCAVGYGFENGDEGYDFYDVVIHDNKYYTCKQAHSKTLLNYPGGAYSENHGLWQQTWNIEAVATKLLLVQYALVQNLGVESLEMKDANGNILCSIKGGEVVCKTGTFENVNVSGELTADCLNLKASTAGHAENAPVLPNGSICVNASALILPELASGAVRSIRILNPMVSRQTPSDLILRPVSSKVRIQSNWSGLFASSSQITLSGKGYNSNTYLELLGFRTAGNDDTTYWLVSEMNNGLLNN